MMDHASELEVVPLSSGIDDIDQLHKPQSHPFASPILSKKKKIPIVVDLQNAIRDKLHHHHHHHKNDNNMEPFVMDKIHKIDGIDNNNNIDVKSHRFISIIAPSIGFFGCQFAWAVQGGYVDPYLRQLGLPDDMMNYAWILGPISGLIFQPMIGVFSDHCESKFGRRRPFFLAGAVILAICLFLFSHAKGIGNDIFTDSTAKSALILAFICFWFLDFSTNFMEGPLRALCADTLNEKEQLQSNSWFGIMNGLASTGGFALGYFTSDIRIIFGVAAFVVISTSILTSSLVNEKKHIDPTKHHNINNLQSISLQDSSDEELGSGTSNNSTDKNDQNNQNNDNNDNDNDISVVSGIDAITLPKDININEITSHCQQQEEVNDNNECSEIIGALKEMVYGLSHMPQIVARCWIVQFCTYFSNFACWVYLTDYFGENIMGGDAIDTTIKSSADDIVARQKYDLGVEYGNLAFMFIAGISAIFSLLGPKLVQLCGLKTLWIICLLIYSFVMILSPIIHNLTTALILFSFIGFPMGASFTLPWAVVSSYSSKKDPNNAGLWLSSLNIAECGPELTVGLLGGIIIDQFKDNVSSVFFIAGIVNLLSVALVLRIDMTMNQDMDSNKKGKYDFVDDKHDLTSDDDINNASD